MKKINKLDEALRVLYLEVKSKAGIETSSFELINILNANYNTEIPDHKAKIFIDSLYAKLNVDSLGSLISKAIEFIDTNLETLSNHCNISISTLEMLRSDSIFANSIPVLSMMNLLKKLKIPFNKVEKGILKTFYLLKNEVVLSPVFSANQLVYKRKDGKVNSWFYGEKLKSESQHLFNNEKALKKYLNRLEELLKND